MGLGTWLHWNKNSFSTLLDISLFEIQICAVGMGSELGIILLLLVQEHIM
jgi:hypothetical protein